MVETVLSVKFDTDGADAVREFDRLAGAADRTEENLKDAAKQSRKTGDAVEDAEAWCAGA